MIRWHAAESAMPDGVVTRNPWWARCGILRRMPSATGRALVNAQAVIESFSLSSDGERLAYGLRQVRGGRYVSRLWSVAWSGGRANRLTSGPVRDVNPAISPDGRLVAFARTTVGPDPGEAQIWIMPLDGGEAWQLTKQRHGAGTPVWSPDGKRLLFLGQAGDDRFIVGRIRPKQPPVARRITRTDFRDDDSGLLGRRTHLWTIAARPGARPRRLTHGDFDVQEPTWAPDGSWIAITADMGDDWNLMPRTALYRVPSGGGAFSLLAELPGDAWNAAISPDGQAVAFLGTDVADPPEYALTHVWLAPTAGGTPHCLTPKLDRSIGNGAWADLVMADDHPGPAWLDPATLVVIVGDRGRNVPYRVNLDGELAPLVAPGRVVGCAVATAAGRVALSAGVDRHAAELYALDGGGRRFARLRRLATNGSGWQARFPLPAWEEAWIDGPGGTIQTWIVSPPRAGSRATPHHRDHPRRSHWWLCPGRDHGQHHAGRARLPAGDGQPPRLGRPSDRPGSRRWTAAGAQVDAADTLRCSTACGAGWPIRSGSASWAFQLRRLSDAMADRVTAIGSARRWRRTASPTRSSAWANSVFRRALQPPPKPRRPALRAGMRRLWHARR